MSSSEVKVSGDMKFPSASATFVAARAVSRVTYADAYAAEYMAVN
jgi:hypothetical protein